MKKRLPLVLLALTLLAVSVQAETVDISTYVINLEEYNIVTGTYVLEFFLELRCDYDCAFEDFVLINGKADDVIILENTPTGLNGMKRLLGLAEKLPSSGICLDIGHANVGHNPVDTIKLFGKSIMSIHASDNNGENDAHLKPGDGKIDFRSVINALREIDYKNPLVYEIRDFAEGKGERSLLYDTMKETCEFHDRITEY